jgi:hypothetical protein
MLGINKYVIKLIYDALYILNKTTANFLQISENVANQQAIAGKLAERCTSGVSLAKGSVDFTEALICKDGICATISGIGCAADTISLLTSCLPGMNATFQIMTPISWSCKAFVHCCKRSDIPYFKSCRAKPPLK